MGDDRDLRAPRVSVVVTAHDAAATLPRTLEALAAQPEAATGELEVVVVDDRSGDGTGAAARAAALPGWRVETIDRLPPPTLTARQAALDRGFRAARGEVVLVTEADALPPPGWVAAMAAPILAGEADLVAGHCEFRGGNPLLAGFLSVDAALYALVGRAAAATGRPSALVFGSAAFRRRVYLETGGFAALGFSFTEDLLFAGAAIGRGSRIRHLPAPAVPVGACRSVGEFLARGQRLTATRPSLSGLAAWGWVLAVPALLALLGAGVPGAPGLLAARLAAGGLLTGTAVLAARRPRLLAFVPLYDLIAGLGAFLVLLRHLFRRPIRWGGVTYPSRRG